METDLSACGGSTANTGNHWVEIQVWGRATVAYVGNYLEWYSNGTTGSPRTMAKYYYAGGQRVAMRHSSGTGTDGLVYLLSDHLGSTSRTVDPLAAANDNKPNVLTELRYKPWGETRYFTGEAGTDFRFTGQRREAALGGTDGLYFYGARWFDPAMGRFVQPDTVVPSPYNPLDWDRYSYVRNNPINNTDPTGHITQKEEKKAGRWLRKLEKFGVSVKQDWGLNGSKWSDGLWTLSELETLFTGVKDLARAMGGAETFRTSLGGVTVEQRNINEGGLGSAHHVILQANGYSRWTVVHEFAHAWDGANGWKLSKDMQSSLGAGFAHPILHYIDPTNEAYWYDPGNGPPPCGIDANFNAKEDFAEAVTAYVYPEIAKKEASSRNQGKWSYTNSARGWNYSSYLDTPRGQYIYALMASLP